MLIHSRVGRAIMVQLAEIAATTTTTAATKGKAARARADTTTIVTAAASPCKHQSDASALCS